MLESLAYSNYESPRPRPIDPTVFFDLVKVRRLVEEATDLAVRAANGTTSSSLSNSFNAGNGVLGGGSASALGLGLGSSGPNAKLSRERKHRMRENATQKLSRAYHFDEIAASVATMQGASSLEEVAKMVLQRSPNDSDAKYVHFFHEKIPSRMLAQCTSLQPLDEVIHDRPTEGAPLRTRAVTRMFKEDFAGAAHDLSEALNVCRYTIAQHKSGRGQLELANALGGSERRNGGGRDWRYNGKIDEADHSSSLEAQLLFHRASVYLTLACQSVDAALDGFASEKGGQESQQAAGQNPAQIQIEKKCLEARKMVKTNAKKALRDYMGFLSHFDYTPGLPSEITEDFFHKVNVAAGGFAKPKGVVPASRHLDMSGNSGLSVGHLSDALVPHSGGKSYQSGGPNNFNGYPSLPTPHIHSVSTLFSASPPENLPPYPATSMALVPRKPALQRKNEEQFAHHLMEQHEQHEAVTYHPLLTDALHALLLCHSLVQTSSKEHLRHAHMVARLARICDGYPIFLSARSPGRADWIEIIRRTNNWIGLQHSWETLCAPAPLPGQCASSAKKEESEAQAKERCRQQAIIEALADERVHDEASFQAAVAARERRAEEQRREELGQDETSPKRWAQEDGREYPISTERAEAISRWVREAPLTVAGAGRTKRGLKKSKEGSDVNLGVVNKELDVKDECFAANGKLETS